MVEFNLLPDIKMQYLRTKRLEHLVVLVSFVVGAFSLAVFIFLLAIVEVGPKVVLSDLNHAINTSSAQLASNTNLNQILTVQHQLETIPQIEAKDPKTSRIFDFISQLTPVNATISSVNISFTTNTVTIDGQGDSLATVNTYVDTIKYATYENLTDRTKNTPAFSKVVLASFGYGNTGSGQTAQYSITFDFDPVIFNSTDNISLVVPSEVTTRSILNQPQLFKSIPTSTSSTSSGGGT